MLRFTIRDVLWLTLVVGLAVGWWVDRGNLVDEWADLQLSLEGCVEMIVHDSTQP